MVKVAVEIRQSAEISFWFILSARLRAGACQMLVIKPPSTRIVDPLMYDRELARKVMTSAYSTGSPYRPAGMFTRTSTSPNAASAAATLAFMAA